MKKNIIKILMLIIVICSVFFVSYEYSVNKKVKYKTLLEIKKDAPLITSLEKLEITKSMYFKLYLKTRDGGKKIKAGYYEIRGNYSIKEIINILESGSSKVEKVTIPEGYSFKNIVKILVKNEKWNSDKIYEALKIMKFPYPTPNGNFEGYFYPETYLIPSNYSEYQAIEIILKEFLKKFPPEKYPDKEDFYQKLIMASIIEREAVKKDEKPIIASAFYNRMKKGMTLSSDATVNYLYDYTKKRMYYKDLEIESPYNTYKNKGLPPAPIASPDKNSVDAAYSPAETDYLFFVAKGDGYHFFSRTYKEHLDFQKKNIKE
ncbi:MAG: endolytic transglycosylase MltG [Fusobacteriaceae bacterium]